MRRPLLLVVVGLVLAGCGGGTTVSPEPETVEGPVPQEATPTVAEGDPEAGRQVFTATAQPTCSSCHTYGPAGSDAQIGPNLDQVLAGQDPQAILDSIVNPDAEISAGFTAGVMPKTYGDALDDQQLADLVAFLTPQS